MTHNAGCDSLVSPWCSVTTCLVTQGRMCRPVRAEEVLWNRINWQEVAWGLGGRQRNRPGSCYYTDLNPQRSFPTATNTQTLCCMIATLHSCKTHSYVQLVVYQSDIFRNNVPRAVFAADTAVTGLWLVSCARVSCPSLGVGRKHRKRLSLGASKVDSAVNKNALNNTVFLSV